MSAELTTLRWQLRWAWAMLGCRCVFNDAHEKIAEEPHCPVHGVYSDKAWPGIEGFDDAGNRIEAVA